MYYYLSHSIFEKNDIISMNLFSCIEFYDVSFHNKFCFMESLLQILIEQNLSTYLLGLLSHLSKMKKNRKCCNWQGSNTLHLITLLIDDELKTNFFVSLTNDAFLSPIWGKLFDFTLAFPWNQQIRFQFSYSKIRKFQ